MSMPVLPIRDCEFCLGPLDGQILTVALEEFIRFPYVMNPSPVMVDFDKRLEPVHYGYIVYAREEIRPDRFIYKIDWEQSN